MSLRQLPTLLLVCLTMTLNAQDLSGTWEGSSGKGDYLKFVLVLAGDHYVGYTYDVDRHGGYCRADFKASFNEKAKKFKGDAQRMLEIKGSHVLCLYNLKYSKETDADWLQGDLHTKGFLGQMASLGMNSSPVQLKRVSRTVDTTTYMHDEIAAAQPAVQEALVITPPATVDAQPAASMTSEATHAAKADTVAFVPPTKKDSAVALLALKEERRSNIVQEITTSEAQLTIRVFDNGLQDGDTVSVLHNNTVVVSHQLVAVKYFEFTVQINDGTPVHDITLIAHNLGSIPPNTASLMIEAGSDRYRLTASTDLERNAIIRIHYQPRSSEQAAR
jgi:hypothetical protein